MAGIENKLGAIDDFNSPTRQFRPTAISNPWRIIQEAIQSGKHASEATFSEATGKPLQK